MANILVEILSDNTPRYSPSNQIQHGDTVTFEVDGGRSVEVSFNSTSCLTSHGPFYLGGSAAASTQPLSVSPSAMKAKYFFTVDSEGGRQSNARTGGNLEAKQGELDVTTDPPKEEAR